MNKAQLVEAIQGEFESKAAAERAVKAVVDGVQKGLKKGGKVQLIGFGTFDVRERGPRTGRNPQTGKAIRIPASKTVRFRPGKSLKDAVN